MKVLGADLKSKKCVPCEGRMAPLVPGQYEAFLREELKGWVVIEEKKLEKEWKFGDFKEALSFVNKVGALAEEEGHHPDIWLHGWNRVRLSLNTHAIGGLSENDFILASKVDGIE